jgi:hypothetical protein
MRAGLSHRRVIIVGAGQAGLAVAAALIAEGLRPQHEFVVMDAAAAGQRSWTSRWHSMELLSDARHSALSPRRLLGDQRRDPRADEMVDYLTYVEAGLGVETVWGVQATGLEHRGNGSTLLLSTTAGEVQTRNVVCATAAAAHPRLPEWASWLRVPGVVLHSSEYLYPGQIPAGDVLIVGGGNSGVQLARELSASHAVTLSTRRVFTVRWRVVSSDGHPISNEYQYTVEAITVPTSTPTPEATEEQTPAPSATTPATTFGEMHNGPSGGGELLPVLAVVSGVIVLGGTLLVVLMVARKRRRRDRAAAASGQGGGDVGTGERGSSR